MEFGRMIRELRQKKGWSVYDLAEKIDKTAGYVSRIEARGEIPSPEVIAALGEALGGDVDELIEVAKAQKSKQVSDAVRKRYDEGLRMYRKQKRKE
jgi:transcriptional regulator with XRE-family HTH domain